MPSSRLPSCPCSPFRAPFRRPGGGLFVINRLVGTTRTGAHPPQGYILLLLPTVISPRMKVICPLWQVMPLGALNCSNESDLLCMSRAFRQRRGGSRGMANGEGFEPPDVLPPAVFKTAALNLSATHPYSPPVRKPRFIGGVLFTLTANVISRPLLDAARGWRGWRRLGQGG